MKLYYTERFAENFASGRERCRELCSLCRQRDISADAFAHEPLHGSDPAIRRKGGAASEQQHEDRATHHPRRRKEGRLHAALRQRL